MTLNYTSKLLIRVQYAAWIENNSSSELTTRLLGNSRLVIPSTVTASHTVHSSDRNHLRTEIKEQWVVFHCYALKPTCRVTLILEQLSSLKSVSSPEASSSDCWTTVQHNILQSISLTSLCDFKSCNDATLLGKVTSFTLLTPFCNWNGVIS